jgi:small subunit ribosomal protein S6
MFILSPELSEEEVENLLERIRGYLAEAEGQVFSEESWGLRRLAYSIQDHREGRYYLVHCTMNPLKVTEFERQLVLLEGLLRELVTRFEGEFAKKKPLTSEPEAASTLEEEEEETKPAEEETLPDPISAAETEAE